MAGVGARKLATTSSSSPGVAAGRAARADAYSPAHAAITPSSSAVLYARQPASGTVFIKRWASARRGSTAWGARGSNPAAARFSTAASFSVPGKRAQVVSSPSKTPSSSASARPFRGEKYSICWPIWGAEPKPWLLCIERLAAASSPKERPRAAS